MLGTSPSFTSQLAAERHARFAEEAAGRRWRRLLRRPHPAPPCGDLAAQLPAVALDLRSAGAAEAEPASSR